MPTKIGGRTCLSICIFHVKAGLRDSLAATEQCFREFGRMFESCVNGLCITAYGNLDVGEWLLVNSKDANVYDVERDLSAEMRTETDLQKEALIAQTGYRASKSWLCELFAKEAYEYNCAVDYFDETYRAGEMSTREIMQHLMSINICDTTILRRATQKLYDGYQKFGATEDQMKLTPEVMTELDREFEQLPDGTIAFFFNTNFATGSV